MKNLISVIVCTGLLAFMSIGCEGLTEGYETDPNNPSDAPADLQLTGSQVALGLFFEAEGGRLASMWAGQFTGSDRQYVDYQNYDPPSSEFNGPWGVAYSNVVQQMRIVQDKSDELNNQILKGIAQVMEAQVMGTVTALWGDVPFEQAGNVDEYPNPNYDVQADVYANVQSLLDEGIANLESGVGIPPEDDIFFGGDADSWIEVAHTLKARYYLHTGEYGLAEQHAGQGISSPEGSMTLAHGGSYAGDLNIYYSFGLVDRPGYLTAVGAFAPSEFLERNHDKTDESERFAYTYVGEDGVYDLNYEGKFGFNASFPLVTHKENQLILAESILQQDIDALGAQEEAIDALNSVRAVLQDEFPDGEYEDFTIVDFQNGGIENPDGDESAGEALWREIIEERYYSLLAQYEVFNDVRRTDNLLGIPANRGDELPERFLYPQSEINSNENVPDQTDDALFQPTPVNQ